MTKLGDYNFEFERFWNRNQQEVIQTTIFDKDKRLVAKGRAVCSLKDCPNKKVGRKKAMAKALTKSEIAKQERTAIWEDYRSKMTKTPRW